MKAIILAAGYATRMYPLTLNKPKALLPLGNRLVIDYIVAQINRLSAVDTLYVVTNQKFFTQFESWKKAAVSELPIEILNDGSDCEDNRLGAIGDIHFTIREKEIDDDVCIIAGDNYFTFDLREQYDCFKSTGCDTVCAGRIASREQLKQFAVAVLDADSRIVSLIEKPQEPPSDIAVYASYFYRRDTVPMFSQYLNEGHMPDAPGYFVQWLHKVKDVRAYIMNGESYDIGTIETYDTVNKMLKDKNQT